MFSMTPSRQRPHTEQCSAPILNVTVLVGKPECPSPHSAVDSLWSTCQPCIFVRNMIKNFQSTLLLCLVEYDGLCRRPFTIYTLNWLIATNTWSATTDCGGRNRTYYLRLMRTATYHLSSPRKKRWESNPLLLVCN